MQPRMTISFRSEAESDLFRAVVYANAAKDGRTASETVVGCVLGLQPLDVPDDVRIAMKESESVPSGADEALARVDKARSLRDIYKDAYLAFCSRGTR